MSRRLYPAIAALSVCMAVLWLRPAGLEHSSTLLGGVGGPQKTEEALDRMTAYLEFNRGPLGIQAEAPDPISAESRIPSIIVRKSSSEPLPLAQKRTRWHYLTQETRAQLRAALGSEGRPAWRRLVVHASGSSSGNALLLNRHLSKRRPSLVDGAYHFVIGNGSFSDHGAVTLGQRWHEQRPSAAMQVADVNAISLSVCLIGDFSETGPHRTQWRALDELVAYLRSQLGPIDVVTHAQIESTAHSCPGAAFRRDSLEQLSARSAP